MKKLFYFSILALSFPALISCVSMSKDTSEQERVVASNKSLKTANCDQLVSRAKDPNYILHNLAGLYAQRHQCAGFSFNRADLTEKELKIFSAGFDIDKTYNRNFKIPRPNAFANTKEWDRAWRLYKSNDTQVVAALNDIVNTTDNMSEKSKALFFLGKYYKKQSRHSEAKLFFEAAAGNDFYSYHALAAYYELGRPLPPINTLLKSSIGSFPFNPSLSFLTSEDLSLFNALMKNEEFGMLDRTCFAFGKSWAECANMGIYLSEKAKHYHMLHFSFSYVNDADKRDLFIRYSHFLYPIQYLEKVKEMSQKSGLPVNLILAIIKQESSFRPYIVNSVPAYGLMQLTPESATDAARLFKFTEFNKDNLDALFDPMINIPLGTYELATSVQRYKGQLTYVGIAYNAGPKRVQDWPKLYTTKDMFEFIEDIPFWETRNYVKMGARNMLFYQRLAEPDKEFYFPKEFIEKAK